MGIEDFITKGIQEVFYFDIFEGFFMVSFVLINIRKKVSIPKFIFHVFMIAILDFLIPALIPIPIVMQVLAILGYSLYLAFTLRINLIDMLKKVVNIYFMFFVIEMIAGLIYQNIFEIQMFSIDNFLKFKFMIPLRIAEFVIIISYYYRYKRKEKRGEFYYENIKKSI